MFPGLVEGGEVQWLLIVIQNSRIFSCILAWFHRIHIDIFLQVIESMAVEMHLISIIFLVASRLRVAAVNEPPVIFL